MTKAPSLDQLKQALDAGLIDQATFDAATAGINAHLTGGGAIAQGHDANAIGAHAVGIARDNYGNVNTGIIIQQGTRPGASKTDLRRAYLARILTQANQLPLFASDSAKKQVNLSSVYTALLTQQSASSGVRDRKSGLPESPETHPHKLSVLDVLNTEPKLVLLGGPGSGKSTFVNFVALSMAGELLGISSPNLSTLTAPPPKEEGDEKDPEYQQWDHGGLLPVHVILRDLAIRRGDSNADVNAETVWDFICSRLKQAALDDFAPYMREELLDRGGLVLLDGLDEVPDANNRRGQIKKAVQDFVATFSKSRFLITSRTYAYQRQEWKLDNFAEVQLSPFTRGQIHRFIDTWYCHMVELDRLTEHDAEDRANVLKRAVERNDRLRELAERPLLLTLIAQLQTEKGGTLPEKRVELYYEAVDMLLNRWDVMKVTVLEDGSKSIEPSLQEWLSASRDAIRKALNRLAFEAHRDQEELTGTSDIRQDKLVAALLNASTNRADVKVGRLEDYLRDRAGILAAHGVGMYQFPHRSFQEYLAACHLTDDDFPDKIANLARDDPNRWREVLLLAGAKAAGGSSLNAWALSESLCLALPPDAAAPIADHWGALLAGRVLVESTDLVNVAPRNTEKLVRVTQWQRAIMRRNILPATERALAGRTLAALGDPRPEVMTLDGMHFCFVPPGSFVMGSGNNDSSAADGEKPQHKVDLAHPYFMARYPVTLAQWREYVRRSGEAPTYAESVNGRDNEPVVNVTWRDARRFCDFLTQAWRDWLPQGFVVALPSEAEWEKAARGGEQVPASAGASGPVHELGEKLKTCNPNVLVPNASSRRIYPWGASFDPDKANAHSAIGEASAVGCYPAGFSPFGCEDMAGNVFEWTRSLWGERFGEPDFKYPYNPDDEKREDLGAGDAVLRVVRGGSWYYDHGYARCACRDWSRRDYRDSDLGFRVVLRSPAVR